MKHKTNLATFLIAIFAKANRKYSQPLRPVAAYKLLLAPFFSESFYLRQNPDVADAGVDPFQHYITWGWHENRCPSPYFDVPWYLLQYPEVAAAGIEPLTHFIENGIQEKRKPHPLIDLEYYLYGAPDVAMKQKHPYLHYIRHGDKEGRSAHPLFSPHYYCSSGPDIRPFTPFAHYIEVGRLQGRSPCPGFDPAYYACHYPSESSDPLMHYLRAPFDRPHFHPLLDGNFQRSVSQRAAQGLPPLVDYMQYRSHFNANDIQRGACSVPRPLRSLVSFKTNAPCTNSQTPKVSVVVPCYKSNSAYLDRCVSSILLQNYDNWELILVNDGSRDETTWQSLQEYCARDPRIRAYNLKTNQGISGATNHGISQAEGEFLAFVDHDDEVVPDALSTMIRRIMEESADVAYSDQAFLGRDNVVGEYCFKPAWSPTLLSGVMYVGHLLIVRKEIAESAGLFKPKYDGCQDFEFMLRLSEYTKKIIHVPEVLYLWRRSEGSVASDSNAKGKIEPLQLMAVQEYFYRIAFRGWPEIDSRVPHRLRLRPKLDCYLDVDVILQEPSVDRLEQLKADFKACDISVKSWQAVRWNHTPSDCLSKGSAPYVLFLNPDVSYTSEEWLTTRIMYAERKDIGFVASHVYSPDGQVIAAGLVVSPEHGALKAYHGFWEGQDGTWGTLFCDREVSALDASCTLIARERLEAIGGLGPHYVSCDGAVQDASYRATLAGLRNISSASRLVALEPARLKRALPILVDEQIFRDTHREHLKFGDKYYNRNFSQRQAHFSAT